MSDWSLITDHHDAYYIEANLGDAVGDNARRIPAIIGAAGLIAAKDKREGDMATPVGRWALRHLFYRRDLLGPLSYAIPTSEITQQSGWCDDPESPDYNRYLHLPSSVHHENLWRSDGAYDLVVMLGYNDAPPVAGHGSAIFLHCIAPDKTSTEGCVAVTRDDLRWLLARADAGQHLLIGDDLL